MGYEAIRLQRPLAVDDIVSVHYFELWLSLLVSHLKVRKMVQRLA